MMKNCFVLILFLLAVSVTGQKKRMATAGKKYDAYSYFDAIDIYEKVAKKGYQSPELFKKLGNAYYFNSDFKKAAEWYESLFKIDTAKIEPEYFYRYAQSLKSFGNPERANEYMDKFAQAASNDRRAVIYKAQTDYLDRIKHNSGRFNIKNAGFNSPYSDFGTSFIKDRLVFTTARDTGGPLSRKMKWTNQAFTQLYATTAKVDGTFSQPEPFSGALNSKFNESSAVFTKDGKTMYFTRNDYTEGKRGRSKAKATLLKLYRATFDGIAWGDEEELPFNSSEYSNAHPALSPDDRTLYFASDMPGSYGQSDLYKVKINADGTFSQPENLGSAINTEGKETFPFISDDNELYFASDGHPGLGGLDIFVTTIGENGLFGEVENIGAPANTPADDFAFMIDAKSRNGFLSSNRAGTVGSDDIFRFTETRKITCEQQLSGNVTDMETGDFLRDAQVSLFDENFTLIKQVFAGEFGAYSFRVKCGKKYYVRATKMTFETKETEITISEEYGKVTLPMELEKRSVKFRKGEDVGPKLGIKIIHFDLDKADIRPDAALELEKVLALMTKYPSMKIDIRSHTDSRQSAKYNLRLSGRRADSTMEWLVSKGISPSRLTAKGYGESQLLNRCSDGVECSEAEHEQNRRSQFIITAM